MDVTFSVLKVFFFGVSIFHHKKKDGSCFSKLGFPKDPKISAEDFLAFEGLEPKRLFRLTEPGVGIAGRSCGLEGR